MSASVGRKLHGVQPLARLDKLSPHAIPRRCNGGALVAVGIVQGRAQGVHLSIGRAPRVVQHEAPLGGFRCLQHEYADGGAALP